MTTQRQNRSLGQAYFDVEGHHQHRVIHTQSTDEEEELLPLLSWRGDPSETLADATIVIVTDELKTATYHVHKNVLCYGKRQSKYFVRHFAQNQKKHRKTSTSSVTSSKSDTAATNVKVELNQRDADNFPILLDFMYGGQQTAYASSNGTVLTATSTFTSTMAASTMASTVTGGFTAPSLSGIPTAEDDCSLAELENEIATHNAVSLRHLARTLEVDAMMLAVNRFIQKDLNFKTGPRYLAKASQYKDERLLESVQRLCVENFEQLNVKALTKLNLDLFRTMVKSLDSYSSYQHHHDQQQQPDDHHQNRKRQSLFLSEAVCRYLEKNPKALSAKVLLDLTDPLLMPYLASEAAIGFTALVKELDQQDATEHWDGLVSLCRRSATTVVQEYGWNDFSVNAAVDEYLRNKNKSQQSSTEQPQPVSRIDSLLFATSFAAALEQAQDDYEEVVVEQERMEDIVSSLLSSITTLEQSNQRKDDHMIRQQGAIDEAKKQILLLKQEIGEIRKQQFKRPPAAQQHGTPPKAELRLASPVREIISPSGNLQTKAELRTKNEMRARSIMM